MVPVRLSRFSPRRLPGRARQPQPHRALAQPASPTPPATTPPGHDPARHAGHRQGLRGAARRRRLRAARGDDPDARRGQALHRDRRAQGRQPRADDHDADALQRRPARRAQRLAAHAGDAAAGRRSVRRRRLHPRVPGRARQVRLGRRLRAHPAAARAAQPDADRSLDRRLRHDRVAGEERARVERPRRHAGQLLRGLHRGDGAREPAPGAEGRGADEPDGRRLDGRRLVPLRRLSPAQPRLHRRPDVGARRRRGHAARRIRRLRDVPAGRFGRRVREGARPRSVRRPGGS